MEKQNKSPEEQLDMVSEALRNLIADIKRKPNSTRYSTLINEGEKVLKIVDDHGKNK